MAERQITRSDLIRFRAEPVTVIVWSPRLPFTKNQPPITVATTRATASTTAAINDPERSKYIGEGTPFRIRKLRGHNTRLARQEATKQLRHQDTKICLMFLCLSAFVVKLDPKTEGSVRMSFYPPIRLALVVC